MFRVYVNPTSRSLSNYPVYVKRHMYNTNPAFDDSAFQKLKYFLENTNVTVSKLVHIFDVPGKYVFADAQNPARDIVVAVLAEGASCPAGHSRVMAASAENLQALGVAKSGDLNQSPDWGLIIGMLAFLGACILLLVVAVIVWRPKHAGLKPLYRWRPLYRSLGRQAPVPEFLGHDEDAMLAAGLTTSTTQGAASDGEVAPREGRLLEEFNARVFYDKLEDQNLHLASQLAQQAEDMRRFYERLCAQNEELRGLLSDIDYDKLIAAQSTGDGGEGGRDLNVNAMTADFRRQGFSGRSAELMAALQLLLERLNSGRIPISSEIIERSVRGAKEGINVTMLNAAGDDLLTQHLKQRMALERELVAEEVEANAKLSAEFEAQRAAFVRTQEEKLARDLAGKSSTEAEQILERHVANTETRLSEMQAGHSKRQRPQQDKLAARRRQRIADLRSKQAEECRTAGIQTAPDLGLEQHLSQTLAMEMDRVQTISDQEAAEGAMGRDASAKEEVLKVGAAFDEELGALMAAAEAEEEEEEAARRGETGGRKRVAKRDEVAMIVADLQQKKERVKRKLTEQQDAMKERQRQTQASRRQRSMQELEKRHESARAAPNPAPGLEAKLEAEAEAER